jgi:hypothetical protein
MTHFTKENSFRLYNGNIGMSLGDAYMARIPQGLLEELSVIWGVNKTPKTAIVNRGCEPVLLKEGYDTAANGRCDDLVLYPNEGIIQTGEGDAWTFSSYRKMLIDND